MKHEQENTIITRYQITIIAIFSALIAILPSLLIWKYHVMSPQDPAVLFGLIVCYAFAGCALTFCVRFAMKRLHSAEVRKWCSE